MALFISFEKCYFFIPLFCLIFSNFFEELSKNDFLYRYLFYGWINYYLPINCFDIYFHLLPNSLCFWNKKFSYYNVHCRLLTKGSKWLYHLSLHCLPLLFRSHFSCSLIDILVQSFFPYSSTNNLIA